MLSRPWKLPLKCHPYLNFQASPALPQEELPLKIRQLAKKKKKEKKTQIIESLC